jgi:CelD/BcsL family acetyltransferase involved in cellulose biosynthesis
VTLVVETVSSIDAFAELEPEWDALVRVMPRPSPFLLHCWLEGWCRYVGSDGSLAVATARRDGRLVGAFPVVSRRRFGVHVGEFIGGRGSALADLLLAEGESDDTARSLVEEVRRSEITVFDLFGLPGDSRLARVAGGELAVRERIEAPIMSMPDGFEAAYKAKRGAKRRAEHRRRIRRLLEHGDAEFTLARTLEDLQAALEEGFRLNALRWDGRPDRSLFATEEGRALHRAVLPRLHELGLPRILLLRSRGRAVAFQYWLQFEGTMVSNRRAFDPEFAKFSPGVLTMLRALEEASADGMTRVEFLGGPEPYKLEFADGFAPLYQGIGLAHGAVGGVAARGLLGEVELRRRVRNSERLHRMYVESFAPVRRGVERLRRAR